MRIEQMLQFVSASAHFMYYKMMIIAIAFSAGAAAASQEEEITHAHPRRCWTSIAVAQRQVIREPTESHWIDTLQIPEDARRSNWITPAKARHHVAVLSSTIYNTMQDQAVRAACRRGVRSRKRSFRLVY